MVRQLLAAELRSRVLTRDGKRCRACGFRAVAALRIHHRTPVEYGGSDNLKDLLLLCSNCHALVHHLGTGSDASVITHLDSKCQRILLQLASEIVRAKKRTTASDGLIRGAIPLSEALSRIASRHRMSTNRQREFSRAARAVIERVPNSVKKKSSFRLLRNERAFSINCTNYLLFRAPAQSDFGRPSHFDCFLIYPRDARLPVSATSDRVVHTFAHFECDDIGLSFAEIGLFGKDEWSEFRTACLKAASARRSRSWPSNVVL